MAENYIEDERELYHFHFSSSQLYEDFREQAHNVIKSTLNELETLLITKISEKEDEIKEQVGTLTELYLTRAEEPLEKFKEASAEIFRLPSNVVLPGYGDREPVTPEELETLKKEVEALEKQYLKEKYFQATMKAELKRFEDVWPLYEKAEKVLGFYKNDRPKPGEKSIKELFDALQCCEKFYVEKKGNIQAKDQLVDEFKLFVTK